MNKRALPIAAFLLLCSFPLPAQKKAPPKAIRFQGAPQYTQDELLAAAGLKPGARLTPSEVKAHARQLNDTGVFAVVKFSTDSKGLLFSLTPVSQLYPIHLDNLPLKPSASLCITVSCPPMAPRSKESARRSKKCWRPGA
jgi:outer membrane protein assembly factor BamA